MAAFNRRNVKGQLPSTAAAQITAATNQVVELGRLTLANASGGSISTIKVHVVPSAGSAADANIIREIASMQDGETVEISLAGHVLYSGDTLQMSAGTATSINYYASYTIRSE